jgi:hypothetical protein
MGVGIAAEVLVGVVTMEVRFPIGGEYRFLGYTEEGITFDYGVSKVQIKVEEEVHPIRESIESETLKITANLAQSSLANMAIAIAGSTLAAGVLSIGDGVDKEMSIRLIGKNEDGLDKTWLIPKAVASGSVGMSFRRNEKTLVPLELTAIKGDGPICTITDS